MSIQEYKTLFEAADLKELKRQYSEFVKTAEQEWRGRIAAEKKRRQPKRKNPDPLDDAFLEALRIELHAKHDPEPWKAKIKAMEEARDNRLDELAEQIEPVKLEAMHRLKTSNTSMYRSQGYGMGKYTRGVLLPYSEKLKELGYDECIRFVQAEWYKPGGMFDCGPCGDYELWANCEPWMFDVIERTLRLDFSLKVLKQNCINPLVYNPFLPDTLVW